MPGTGNTSALRAAMTLSPALWLVCLCRIAALSAMTHCAPSSGLKDEFAVRATNHSQIAAANTMSLYTVRIPGLRLTVSAFSVWDAIDQVKKLYPLHRGGSAKPA